MLPNRWGRVVPRLETYLQASAFLLYFAIVVVYQWLSQAYTMAFGGYSDEPAHYVTALMIRDYILSGFSGSPLAFAERYYVHYPAVAFGMWGPVIHVLSGVWMAVFSDSRVSILLLMAVIAASLAWSAQWMIGRAFGRLPGVLAGLAICLIPAFQAYSVLVMADILTGTLILWATYCWSRYLDSGEPALAWRFGVFATLAVLSKANAGSLALLPIPAALMAGRADLFRRRHFWLPAVMVGLIAGPWCLFYAWLMANLTRVPTTFAIVSKYLTQGLGLFGVLTIPLVLAGVASGFFHKPPYPGGRPLWAAAVSMSLGFIAYHCLVPGGFEDRYVLMIAPWIAILLILGAEWIAGAFLPFRRGVASTILLAAIVVYGVAVFRVHPKTNLPYAQVAYDLIHGRELPQSVFLVSSESSVETMMVAEVAMQDRRPNHFVLRASKMFARMNWNGDRYENRVTDEAEMRDDLRAWGVSRVIVDTTPGPVPWPHHRMLRAVVAADPQWRLTRRYGPVEVYEFQGVAKMPEKIQVDVPYTLRLTLEAATGK